MSNARVRFGVIGVGHARAAAQTEGVELIAVADINEQLGQAAASQFGARWYKDYIEMLDREDVEAVMITTPNGLHAPMGVECAKRGIHIAVTKPMAVNLDHADMLIGACEEHGVNLIVDFGSRRSEGARRVHRAIEQQKFGRLILCEVSAKYYRPQSYYDGHRGTWAMGGGATMTIPVHSIDLMQWFMGPVESVIGLSGVFAHEMESEDLTLGILRFRSGAVGSVVATTSLPPFQELFHRLIHVSVHGTTGAVSLRGGSSIEYWYGDVVPPEELAPAPKNIFEEMVALLRRGAAPSCNGREGRKSIEIVEAMCRSASEGSRPVKLPLSSKKTRPLLP